MEELFAYAILICAGIESEEAYHKRLDELFLDDSTNEIFLNLEWQNDIRGAFAYIEANVDYTTFDEDLFGKSLMERLRKYYDRCPDIREFAAPMYNLWEILPDSIQDKQPFFTLCYADDPLSWGDEAQTTKLYNSMLDYYKD